MKCSFFVAHHTNEYLDVQYRVQRWIWRDGWSEFEDLAFPSRSTREPDNVGSEDCVSTIYLLSGVDNSWESLGVRINKQAEFAGPKKVGEGMALKIWAELRQPPRDSS